MMNKYKVIIVGAGPAGIATGIQLKRYGICPVIFEKDSVGGLLKNANLVENYPGFPNGISGSKLVQLFRRQLSGMDIDVSSEEVLELEFHDDAFLVKTNLRELKSKIAVIASGTKPKEMMSFSKSVEVGDRIFYEIYPILDVRDKNIVIIGSGDAAFDYALNLSKQNQVTIINRSDRVKCLPILWERCEKSARICYQENTEASGIKREGDKLLLNTTHHDNGGDQLYADFLVVAIGREPFLDFLGKGLGEKYKELCDDNKLYPIGDVKNGFYRQVAISVGDGLKAAMSIARQRGIRQ